MTNTIALPITMNLAVYNALGKLYSRLSRLVTIEQYDRCRSWFIALVAVDNCMRLDEAAVILDMVIAERIRIVKSKPVLQVNTTEGGSDDLSDSVVDKITDNPSIISQRVVAEGVVSGVAEGDKKVKAKPKPRPSRAKQAKAVTTAVDSNVNIASSLV